MKLCREIIQNVKVLSNRIGRKARADPTACPYEGSAKPSNVWRLHKTGSFVSRGTESLTRGG